jgi:CheY-like chemotaxis protein
MTKPELRPIDILLVEDDPADIRLAREALQEGRINNRLFIVRDGDEALDFLHHRGRFADPAESPRPGLILLDLNMPRRDGREVLELIKADAELHTIPVIVLTASTEESDILRSYNQEAASYMIKPIQVDEFMAVLREHGAYSVTIVANHGGHYRRLDAADSA